MAKKVVVFIDEDGKVSVEGQGFHGKECEQIIDAVTAGFDVKKTVKKKEYYEKPLKEKTKVSH